jgi:hypothetical protein
MKPISIIPDILGSSGKSIESLSENHLRRGGQSPFSPRTPKNGTVPDDFRIGSEPACQLD